MSTIKNRIKVFARLKRESKSTKLLALDVVKQEKNDIFTFSKEKCKHTVHNFRFDRVFTEHSEQCEVFDTIAKPVINGLFDGFNGTIFAYGQTGSGKTYALTGSQYKFAHRGLIPRTIEYIFKNAPQNKLCFEMSISYLEIYNEIAYDLLNSKENASTLEELPRIVLLEDTKGEAHYRNLTVKTVTSEHQAMQLLYLGDTNRTIAETPLNEYSSRSHCIFTVYVVIKNKENGIIKKAKLNLVDLAGSERLHKINLDGVTLSEAKSINLSLHYLEQVILALAETKRPHIPFRNSVMTFMLRDSIAGNCMTVMLATLSLSKDNYEETLTTCKFAQRVSMIKNDVCINEEVDIQEHIALLKNEVKELKNKLVTHGICSNGTKELSKQEEIDCKKAVKKFLSSNSDLPFTEIHKFKYCALLLKEEINKKDKIKTSTVLKLTSEAEKKYKELLKQKNTEISLLMKTFEKRELALPPNDEFIEISRKMLTMEKEAFRKYISNHENRKQLTYYYQALQEKHKHALHLSHKITKSQAKILETKKSLCMDVKPPENTKSLLKHEQESYRKLLDEMQNIKSEIEYLKNSMAKSKRKVIEDFKLWLLNKTNVTSIKSNSKLNLEKFDSCLECDSTLNYKKTTNEKLGKFEINKKLDELFKGMDDDNNKFQRENVDSFYKKIEVSQPNIYKDNFVNMFGNKNIVNSCYNLKLNTNDQFCNNMNVPTRQFSIMPQIKEETKKPCLINNDLTGKNNKNYDIGEDLHKKKEDNSGHQLLSSFINQNDNKEFIEFMRGVPLTGDFEVDEEITKFYRVQYNNKIN